MLPQITLIDCISSGKFKVPIITNTTPLNMLENNIDISKAPLIRLIFILRLFSSYNSNYLLLLFLCNMTIATISIMIIIGICLTRKLYVPLYRYLSYLDTLFSSSCMYDNKCSFLCETVSEPNNSDNLTAAQVRINKNIPSYFQPAKNKHHTYNFYFPIIKIYAEPYSCQFKQNYPKYLLSVLNLYFLQFLILSKIIL